MAAALTHASTPQLVIPGVVLEGFVLPMREPNSMTTKFWGLRGESRINGKPGGRLLDIPLLLHDVSAFASKTALANYIDDTLNVDQVEKLGDLTIHSESSYPTFNDCTFEGCLLIGGIKTDEAGTLGGSPFAFCRMIFRQHN